MITGDYNFDMARAKDGLSIEYGDAYAVSNEPLNWEIGLTPVAGRRVLTVAASGDQPLMYAAYGASHIDTFDLTYNAHVITDFKTSALHTVDYDRYKDIVSTMYDLNKTARRHGKTFTQIIDRMPADTAAPMREYITANPNAFCREVPDRVSHPVDDIQYDAIQRTVKESFDFIWADLMDVHKYLIGQYDIMNLSNIFDHYEMAGGTLQEIIQPLVGLWAYLKPGGHVVCMGILHRANTIVMLGEILKSTNMARTEFKTDDLGFWQALIIQKQR